MGHDHSHDHTDPPSDPALRVKALESLLVEKGLVDPAAIDEIIETYETKVGPRNGAKVVARAWTDPDFKSLLLSDANKAIHSIGYTGRQGEHMKVVENTDTRHNLVVCTLCSCYPWTVLGLPPVWDSTSEMRFLVLPQHPEGTDGWTTEELEKLVTRNSMIGVEQALTPARLQARESNPTA